MPSPIRRVKRREPVRVGVTPGALSTADRTKDAPDAVGVLEPGVKRGAECDVPATPKKQKLGASHQQDWSEPRVLTPPATPTAFSLGKALFQRGSCTRDVTGRVSERAAVDKFVHTRVAEHTGGALYICGLPGTGKTAVVTDILSAVGRAATVASINCMTIDRADLAFSVIAKEFGYLPRRASTHRDQVEQLLSERFAARGVSHVLLLDELDHILTSDQEVLFKIFEWACRENSNLVVIGIANAIDLTDRFLPRLQAHKLVPEVVRFKAYTKEDIMQIIEQRLRTLCPGAKEVPLMHPAAIRLCATKGANSGDLRKAFDICRRALEIVEHEFRASEQANIYDVLSVPKASVQTINEASREAFGGVSSLSQIEALNFQQKAVLCVLILTERKASSANLTINQIFHAYEKRCEVTNVLGSLQYPEFLEVVSALESAGVTAVSGVCSKKGLGSSTASRTSRGGGGASASRGSEGHRDEYGLRRLSSRVQIMHVVTALSKTEQLKALLLSSL